MDGSELISEIAGLSILSGLSQHRRLLRLDFPRDDAPAHAVLLVNSLVAEEELSRDFRFSVELISDSAHIDPVALMAKMATVSMVRNDGSLRYFNGYVTEFHMVRADGGLAFYHMVLEPWLAFARLTEDCYSFHDRSVIELTEDTFADYLERDWKLRLAREYPKLSCANQYNESDHNHLHRRWEAAGLYYWYEHRADGHTLWLGDQSGMAEPIDAVGDAPGEIRFKAEAGSFEDDAVREWKAVRRVKPGVAALVSFDYKNPCPRIVYRNSLNRQGDVFAREVYQDTGYRFGNSADGEAMAQQKMEAIAADALQFEARGNERNAMPGRYCRLADHFSCEPPALFRSDDVQEAAASEYLIVKVVHKASNNYQVGKDVHSHYDGEFTCVPSATPWRPRLGHNSAPHPDPGILTATVVGPKGEDVYTDELGRVKLQFHWDRVGQFDVRSSPWIRVVSPLAGAYMGQQSLPRVGQEVAVQFVGGNIDYPIILGGDYNALSMPPWQLPGERTLMGLRSCEFRSGDGGSGGQRSNHLILDDTNGKIQAQLKSDHQHSQLSLGHITRIEDSGGRKDFRGEGWELRTDGHGVARAARGLLLTTEERTAAQSHIKDLSETVLRFGAAQAKHDGLAQLAQKSDAKDDGQQVEVVAAIQKQVDEIKGTGATGGFPQLCAPHLVLTSPAGIESSTRGSTHLASDEHTAVTTGRSLSLAAGESMFASVRHAIRLFVHKAGMKLIAAAGDVDVHALTDSINLLAKLNITQTANRITINAKEEIVINGGGSYGKFSSSGIEFGTNGNYVSHASKHSLVGPQNMDVVTTMPPISELAGKGVFNLGTHAAAGGRASAGMPFTLFRDGAAVEKGQIDDQGNMTFEHEIEADSKYAVELPNGQRFVVDPEEQLEAHMTSAGLGFHGYQNVGGSLTDEHASLEKDRLLSNPALRGS